MRSICIKNKKLQNLTHKCACVVTLGGSQEINSEDLLQTLEVERL